GEEPDQGNHEQARVELLASVILHEASARRVIALPADFLVNAVPEPLPAGGISRQAVRLDVLHRAIRRDPRHDLGVREVTLRAADLPDAFVRLAPRSLEEFEELLLERPRHAVTLDPDATRLLHRVPHRRRTLPAAAGRPPLCPRAPALTPRSQEASRGRAREGAARRPGRT